MSAINDDYGWRATANHEQYTQYCVNPPEYILPHSDFGDPECWGLLLPVERGDFADIVCNECGAIIQSVNAADLRRALDEMQLELDVASERCPHCGSVNLLPGFSQMLAFTCRSCGRAVVTKAL
jgi:ribosomal protein S27E